MDVIHGNFNRMNSKLALELKHFNKLKKIKIENSII